MKRLLRLSLFTSFVLLLTMNINAQGLQPLPIASSSFTLEYPLGVRPAKIVRKFIPPASGVTPHEGIDLYAPAGANVRAGASGKVKKVVPAEDGRGYGAYIVIATRYNGITYKVTYANLKDIVVTKGQTVDVGEKLAKAGGAYIKTVIQASQGGMSGFAIPNVVNPKSVLRLTGLRLRPVDNGLRVRSAPDLNAPVLTQIHQWDILSTPENHYKALSKTGRNGWLRITLLDGRVGYASAQYLKVVAVTDSVQGIPGIPIRGMNLDRYHPLGTPPAAPLAQLGWVRINYNVSYNPDNGSYGNTDLAAAYNRYAPLIRRYAQSGNKVILVFTHQFYGEGAGYVWEQMNPALWQQLTNQYSDMARQVAAQYRDEKLIYAYQIWNEQDTLPGNGRAAVPVPSSDYANLLMQTVRAIRSADSRVKVITGGHISGNALGVAYAKDVLSRLPSDGRPNGIAVHPYGVGPVGSPFNLFGTINDLIKVWSGVMPNTPLWITEWGVLDYQGNDGLAGAVALHAEGFTDTIEQQFPGMVAAAVWFAWADGMDNGYGMVNMNNQPKQPLYTSYLGTSSSFSAIDLNGLIPLPPAP